MAGPLAMAMLWHSTPRLTSYNWHCFSHRCSSGGHPVLTEFVGLICSVHIVMVHQVHAMHGMKPIIVLNMF